MHAHFPSVALELGLALVRDQYLCATLASQSLVSSSSWLCSSGAIASGDSLRRECTHPRLSHLSLSSGPGHPCSHAGSPWMGCRAQHFRHYRRCSTADISYFPSLLFTSYREDGGCARRVLLCDRWADSERICQPGATGTTSC